MAPNGVAPASVSGLESTFAPEEQLAHLLQDRWSPAVFAAIEWRRFEALCEAFYAQVGLETRSQSHGADGGVDIWLQSKHMPEPRIVQCKHWKSKPVGVKELREFRGVMASNQLKHGTYVTSSTFTAEAAAFAKSNRIQTQDGAALLKPSSASARRSSSRPCSPSRMKANTGGLPAPALWREDGGAQLHHRQEGLLGLRQLPELPRQRRFPRRRKLR